MAICLLLKSHESQFLGGRLAPLWGRRLSGFPDEGEFFGRCCGSLEDLHQESSFSGLLDFGHLDPFGRRDGDSAHILKDVFVITGMIGFTETFDITVIFVIPVIVACGTPTRIFLRISQRDRGQWSRLSTPYWCVWSPLIAHVHGHPKITKGGDHF